MVCKKDVVTWFKNLKSHKRVDVMCSLLQLCVPFELRFLGTCLEDLAKRDYQDLRQTETEANSLSELNSPEVQSITNQETRTKLALYVSLLHSYNDACSNKIFKILTKDDINTVLNLAMTDNLVLEELLSIYTLVLNHPAFSFDQKIAIDKIFSKLQDEESRLYDQNVKNKQSNFSHTAISDSIHERIPQPNQSYQPCVDDGHQPCYTVTNAVGPCPPIPPAHHHQHTNKPYMPYGGESSDDRRLGGGWSGGLPCDNGSSIVVRPSSLAAPACDPSSSPMMSVRGSTLPPGCDQPISRVSTMPPPCDPSGSPLMGSRVVNPPSDTVGPVPRVANTLPSCDQPPSGSPLMSRNNSPCQSPSRPSTPPRHRLPQSQPASHSPPPRHANHKDQTKDVPVPNVPIDQLTRMNDEELREVGLPQNAILQLRSLNKHVSNGLPPPPPLMDYRKKPDMMLRSVEGYPGGGVCMNPAVPCCFSVPSVSPRPKYGPIPPQVYPALESLGVIRLDQESNSSASDTASDHSPPDTPGPQDPVAGRRIHNPPPPRRPNNSGPHHNHINQGVIYRRRDGGGMVNGCDDRKVYSGDGPGSYYSPPGAGPPAWPHQYIRPPYPAPHFPHFVPTQHRPHPQPFPYNGELMYPYAYQPYPPTTHLQVTKISCYNCGSPSHAPVDCPELTMEEITNQGQYKIDYSKNGGSGPGGPQISSSTSPGELPPPNTDK